MSDEEEKCGICGKGIDEYDIYHIDDVIGHASCFTKAVSEYRTQKNRTHKKTKNKKGGPKNVGFVTLSAKGLTFYGTIDEAKDLAVEIRETFNTASKDMSNRLNDFVFLLETEYQTHYQMDQDDWGYMDELKRA
jgi:hypothetical protein